MRIIQLAVTTDASGDGVAVDPSVRKGYVLCVDYDYSGSAGAGTDVTLTCDSQVGPDVSIDSIANANTDVRRYPLSYPNPPGGAVTTDLVMPIPFFGNLTLTVAQGGATVTNCVVATIYMAEVP